MPPHVHAPGGATRRSRRVVVTGGAGFLGSHLCTALVAHGLEVVALDDFSTGSPANVAHLLDDPSFRLVRCDVTDFVHVPGPVDLVLHFASPASPADYLRIPVGPVIPVSRVDVDAVVAQWLRDRDALVRARAEARRAQPAPAPSPARRRGLRWGRRRP